MSPAQPDGYLALPAAGKGSPVLVLHAWWGLNDTIKSVCNRLAGEGFATFAADLYHGKVAKEIADAEKFGGEVDSNVEGAMAEVANAAAFIQERSGSGESGIAVVAFSLGGCYALNLSTRMPDTIRSVVLFYGTCGTFPLDYGKSKADYLGHFAEKDPYEPPSNADGLEKSLRDAGRPVTFYNYPGADHWFFEPDRPAEYNPEAAKLAWERTLAFLKR